MIFHRASVVLLGSILLVSQARAQRPLQGPTGPVAMPPTGISRAPAVVAGPAPVSLKLNGTPAETVVSWSQSWAQYLNPAPTGYVVDRWNTNDPACCRATSPVIPESAIHEWHDIQQTAGNYTYQVTAIYADGRRGSASVAWDYPMPVTPAGVKAVQTERNTVVVSWTAVPGVSYYIVGGPPTNQAVRVNVPTMTFTGVQPGKATFVVGTIYEGATPTAPKAGSPLVQVPLNVVNTHYRLTAEAIRVDAETVDQQFSGDGMYDEVYVASTAQLFERPSPTTGGGIWGPFLPIQLSKVHGDVGGAGFYDRQQAGTASGSGGLHQKDYVSPIWAAPSGTMYAGTPTMPLWEGDLIPGKHDLILHPMIWEVDQPTSSKAREPYQNFCEPSLLCGWWKFLNGPGGGSLSYHALAAAPPNGIQVVDAGYKVWFGTSEGGPMHMERQDRDRPIGLAAHANATQSFGLIADWMDKGVVLSSERIEALLATGKNRFEVRFWDHWENPGQPWSRVDWLNGDYTLVIRIDRVP